MQFPLGRRNKQSLPKSQSSLLEVMEEHQISIDGKTHELPSPFMVLATQNPVETYMALIICLKPKWIDSL